MSTGHRGEYGNAIMQKRGDRPERMVSGIDREGVSDAAVS
jgi:hypothetical protein